MADLQELYPRRVEAAAIALGRGDRHEAERLYGEALVMGREKFGANDPALAVPLNELSRLYVRRSEYARAEPLLHHLLLIRRAGGEHHPDVATVLAALAAVRRGLGDDAGAEALYRQALAIREMVHAPDHMAVVVTLEQLADTCVALRKFAEARPFFERALAAREVALGAEHPTARALHDRLTELTAMAARIQPDASRPLPAPLAGAAPASAAVQVPLPLPAPAPAPEEHRISKELVFLYEPEKPVRRPSVRRDRVMTPPFSAAVAAASLIGVPVQASATARVSAPMELSVTSLTIADPREFDAAIKPRVEDERMAHDALPRRSQRTALPTRTDVGVDRPSKRIRRYGMAAGGLAMFAGAAFFASARLPGRTTSEPSPLAPEREPSAMRAPIASRAVVVAAPARFAVVRADSARPASAKASPVASAPLSLPVARQPAKDAAVAELPLLPNIGGLVIPETKAPNADSVMRASTVRHDAENDQIGSSGRLRMPTLGEDRAETSPVLIGAIPQPRFPDALRSQGVEGAVVVQFLVGTDGSVDASTMKVVRSPHDLFTAAVRSVLPRLHFQPARTADAKPRAEWVQYSIQFSATK